MGEGGALVINHPEYNEKAEILREKGTNRAKFFRGQVDKYTWVDYGSSYLPSDLNAAYLYAQLESADKINTDRLTTWNIYHENFQSLQKSNVLSVPFIPKDCEHNAHMYYVKLKNLSERTKFISYLKERGIQSAFHYIPLHASPAGRKFGRFFGADDCTSSESEKLTRLPLYYGISDKDRNYVISCVLNFFQ